MIVNDKMLAYSYILVHEGYPGAFWYDYNNGLARTGKPNGTDALIAEHHRHAAGDSQILHVDPDLYIIERSSDRDDIVQQSGLVYVLNNLGYKLSGTTVKTKWNNHKFVPVAWESHP